MTLIVEVASELPSPPACHSFYTARAARRTIFAQACPDDAPSTLWAKSHYDVQRTGDDKRTLYDLTVDELHEIYLEVVPCGGKTKKLKKQYLQLLSALHADSSSLAHSRFAPVTAQT